MTRLDALTPGGVMRITLWLAEQSAAGVGALAGPGDAALGFQELRNKLRAFSLFAYPDEVLGLGGRSEPLPVLASTASRLNPYDAVWATEGVGHLFAQLATDGGLLRAATPATAGSPALIALHSGMGLALAKRSLQVADARCRGADVSTALQRFSGECHHNSRPGYAGAALEALGLVARNLYPHLVTRIGTELTSSPGILRELFWHGVGRALYFTPSTFTPFSSAPWPAAEMASGEPPDDVARNNAVAGLVWALLLVNIRHPRIIEAFLRHHAGALPAAALHDGVRSAVLVWRSCSPRDAFIDLLLRHQPDDPELWREFLQKPVEGALASYDPGLAFGELFRYRNSGDVSGVSAPESSETDMAFLRLDRPPCAGLFDQMIARPLEALAWGFDLLRQPVGVGTVDGILSRFVHTLAGGVRGNGNCRCGCGDSGARNARSH